MNKKLFILLNFLIIIISILDYKAIPFYDKLGLDFSNQYGFHHCVDDSKVVYKRPAVDCLDFEARPYIYPPLLYVFFSWTRIFDSVDYAYYFFVALYFVSFIAIVYIWSDKKLTSLFFGFGLFFTFPSLFLIERGNSDLFITLTWSLGYFFYTKKKQWKAGFLLAFSVFAKLYPLYGIVILAGQFIRNFLENVKTVKSFIISAILLVLLTPNLWFVYLVDVLPKWSKSSLPLMSIAHSLKSLPMLGGMIFLLMIISWFIASYKSSRDKMGLVWAGAIAISTFNNGVSYDYNLVTFFPLALCLFNYLLDSELSVLKYIFLGICFFIFGSRYPLESFQSYLHVKLLFVSISLITIPIIIYDLAFELKKINAKARFLLSKAQSILKFK